MPNDPIQVFGLGEGGVNVDDNPLRLDDNQLRQSQNATHYDIGAREGALSTRPGFERFNLTPFSGSVLGGIEAPYQGTAAASGSGGGGAAGDIGGTGNPSQGTGTAPGDAVAGAAGGGTLNASALSNSQTTKLFGGKRIIVIGCQSNNATGAGFYLTSEGFADPALTRRGGGVDIIAGPPMGNYNTTFPNCVGNQVIEKRAITVAGALYYPQDIFNLDTSIAPTTPSIRRMSPDGNVDTAIIHIPDSPSVLALREGGPPTVIPNHSVWVTALCPEWGNDDALWVAVYDKVSSGSNAGDYGRVLRLTGLLSGTYAFETVFDSVTGGLNLAKHCVPYALENFLGGVWVGIWAGVNTLGATGVAMIRRAGTTGWETVKSHTFSSDASASDTICLKTFNGSLFMGEQFRDPSVANAYIWSLNADGTSVQQVQGSGGTAVTPTGWVSMEEFQGNLYASYLNAGVQSKIYKFDGTTWSTVFTASSSAKNIAFILKADGQYLYAFGGERVSTNCAFLVTTDGSSWTDKTANFVPAISIFTPINLLFGINQ